MTHPCYDYDALYELADLGKEIWHRQIDNLVCKDGSHKGKVFHAPRKSEERTNQKVRAKYANDYSLVCDFERATAVFENVESMFTFLCRLQRLGSMAGQKNLRLVRFKDRMSVPLANGYRDYLVNILETSSGFI